MSRELKDFFHKSTKKQISDKNFINLGDNWLELISELAFSDNYTIIPATISAKVETQKQFSRHGEELKLKRSYSREQALQSKTPSELKQEKFNSLITIPCCYSIKPYLGTDTTPRRFTLTDCVRGAQLYSMSEQVPGEKIKVKPYQDAKIVDREGAKIDVYLPSRAKGEKPYKIRFGFIPILDNENKNLIWMKISSDHECEYKSFKELRYAQEESNESSTTREFCFHDIAGYLAIIDYFKNEYNNLIPLEMSPIVIPSRDTAMFNVALENNVLLYDGTIDSKNGLRKPKLADKEMLNWMRVSLLGFYATFYADKHRDGDVRDYRWN